MTDFTKLQDITGFDYIIDHPNYMMNRSSDIIKVGTNDELIDIISSYMRDGKRKVVLDYEEHDLATLMAYQYYGQCNAKIKLKDNTDYSLSSIYYDCENRYFKNGSLYIDEEEFRPVPLYPGYYINQMGAIFSTKSNIIMRRKYDKGYPTVVLCPPHNENRRYKLQKIHRIVFSAWVRPLKDDELINHKDENKAHSYVWNLEVCDALYNTRYSIRTGTKPVTFTPEEVDQIGYLHSIGFLTQDILDYMGLDGSYRKKVLGVLYNIKRDKSYADVKAKYNISSEIPSRYTLTPSQVHEICRMLEDGQTGNSISKKFGVSPSTIYKIRDRERFKYISKDYNW